MTVAARPKGVTVCQLFKSLDDAHFVTGGFAAGFQRDRRSRPARIRLRQDIRARLCRAVSLHPINSETTTPEGRGTRSPPHPDTVLRSASYQA